MADIAKRGPGRPKATAAVTDTRAGTTEPEYIEIDLPDLVTLEPVIETVLVERFVGGVYWVHPESTSAKLSNILAYGWSDGAVTWKETR